MNSQNYPINHNNPFKPTPLTLTSDEWLTSVNLRKLSAARREAAQNLIFDFAEKTEGLPDSTPAPEPADDGSDDGIIDQPYHEPTRRGDVRKAWAIYGALIGAALIDAPDTRNNSRWHDNTDCTIQIIADTLAQLTY